MAVVEPGRTSSASWTSAPEWEVPGDGDRRGHRHRPAGDDLARRAGRGHPAAAAPPTTARSTDRPARAPARPGRAGRRRPVPAGPARQPAPSCARRCSPCWPPPDAADKSWVTEQYDRYVRGDTVLAMPHDAGLIRVDEQTWLGVALATDGNGRYCLLDPYAGHAARAGRGLPQRGRHRRPAAGRHQLPQLRLARGPRGDVAVHRGGARAGRRLPGPGHAGDRRATSASTTRPVRRGDPPDPGRRGPRRPRRRAPAAADRLRPGGLRRRAARRDRGRARRVAVGPGRARAPGRPPASGGPGRRARPWPPCWWRPPAAACWPPRTTCPTAGWPWRWPSAAWPGARAPRARCPGEAFTLLFSESAARAVVAVRPGARGGVRRAVRRGRACPAAVLGVTGGASLEVAGLFAIGLDELAAAHRGTLPALFD